MTVCEKAPAKINLGLCITGRRADGYHDILSIFQTVDLFDTLCISREGGERLICSAPDVPSGADNLVLRAEESFCSRFGISTRVSFTLEKRIPVGGGLGGGSSDAAAALRGLRTVHGIDASDEELCRIAGKLGSDIPFLVKGGTAVVSGRGDIITEVQWPFDLTYVLVHPGFGVSTSWAYSTVTDYGRKYEQYRGATEKLLDGVLSQDEFFDAVSNDFESVVYGSYPVLENIRSELLAHGARRALLTGSGSTMVGMFEESEAAHACASKLKLQGFETFVVKAC